MRHNLTSIAALSIFVLATSCGNSIQNNQNSDTNEISDNNLEIVNNNEIEIINKRVEELVKFIPDHQMVENGESYYTTEYYNLLKKAWGIPNKGDGMIGDEEFLYYFIEGNGECEGNHKVVPTDTKILNDSTASVTFDYYHSETNKNSHNFFLIKKGNNWIISNYDDTKALLTTYINNNFRTPDLAFMEVCGNVKSVKYKNKRRATFDKNGNITEYKTAFAATHNFDAETSEYTDVDDNGNVPVYLSRDDSQNYIISVYDGPGGNESFEYDTIHILLLNKKSGEGGYWFESKFSYNENFIPIVLEYEIEGNDTLSVNELNIKIEETDSHNNWTKRTIGEITEERIIEYFE